MKDRRMKSNRKCILKRAAYYLGVVMERVILTTAVDRERPNIDAVERDPRIRCEYTECDERRVPIKNSAAVWTRWCSFDRPGALIKKKKKNALSKKRSGVSIKRRENGGFYSVLRPGQCINLRNEIFRLQSESHPREDNSTWLKDDVREAAFPPLIPPSF